MYQQGKRRRRGWDSYITLQSQFKEWRSDWPGAFPSSPTITSRIRFQVRPYKQTIMPSPDQPAKSPSTSTKPRKFRNTMQERTFGNHDDERAPHKSHLVGPPRPVDPNCNPADEVILDANGNPMPREFSIGTTMNTNKEHDVHCERRSTRVSDATGNTSDKLGLGEYSLTRRLRDRSK